MNVRYPMGVLHSFSIKNNFYDKMNLRLKYFIRPRLLHEGGPRLVENQSIYLP